MLNNQSSGTVRSKILLKSMLRTNPLLTISLGLIIAVAASPSFAYAETDSVIVDGTSYDVTYDVTEITVLGFDVDLDFKSLTVFVDAPSSGSLSITLERNFFDSVSVGADEGFFVLTDGEIATFEETETTSEYRVLRIDVSEGTLDVEIIGSEFGSSNDTVEDTPEPVEAAPEPVEAAPEPVEAAPEPVEAAPEPVEAAPEPKCGPGTVLEDDVCVLEPTVEPVPSPSDDPPTKHSGAALIYGVVGAFIIAGAVGGILGSIHKAGKRRNR